MSFSASDVSDGEEDHNMDNIRAMLQDYYGTDTGDEVKEEDYYDMDSKLFDKDKFVPKILKEQSLPELIKTNVRVISEAKQLDSDMQKLVYENYSRFMSASKTVRTLQDNVGDMETRMSNLLEKIQVVSSVSGSVGTNLDVNRSKVDKLVSVKRLLKKLQFLFDLPSRLQRCVELEAYDQAVEYYTSSSLVLTDYRHIKSFNTIQEAADAIMNKLKAQMFVAIQEPNIRMTQLEDFVRLLLRLGHPIDDLYTIYLNYHKNNLNDIIQKFQKLKPLSEDEKEIICLSGSETEVETVRAKQKVTSDYPLMQFMSSIEKEFIDIVIHVAVAFMDIFKNNEKSLTSLLAFTQSLMEKYLQAVSDRISADTSYEHVLEADIISPFGEVRSALDMLSQHVVKVDNILHNTGLLTTMRSMLRNAVKTQMAGSFDTVRSEVTIILETADTMARNLAMWTSPKPKAAAAVVATKPVTEPTSQPEAPLVSEDLFSTVVAPVAGQGPITLPSEIKEPVQPVEKLTASPEMEKELKFESVTSVGQYVTRELELELRRVVERLHSLLSLLQSVLPESLPLFTEYFYTQIQQTLLWFCALLLKSQSSPHPLLFGRDNCTLTFDIDKKRQYVYLNSTLVELLPDTSLTPRCALGLFGSCRMISKTVIKSVVQTLVDYTPDDQSVDQEKLTVNMNLSSLIQSCNDTANIMLRHFCQQSADTMALQFITDVLGSSEMDVAIMPTTHTIVRELFTCFMDCNDAVCDVPAIMKEPVVDLLITERSVQTDDGEMNSYMEKAMSSRVRVLPIEVRTTMKDVMNGLLKTFAKEIMEEIRSTVVFDYQLHNIVVNLSFIITMVTAILPDMVEIHGLFEEIVHSALDRCYGPSVITDDEQKKLIKSAIEEFRKQSSE